MSIEKFREIGMIAAVCEELELNIQDYPILLETGTYRGATAVECAKTFKKVYTIELSQELYEWCKNEYQEIKNIEFLCGDSAQKIKDVLPYINDRYILFLDAHGSGGDTSFSEKYGRFGTPILNELEAVISNPPDVIIIDDYRDYQHIDPKQYIKDNLGEYFFFSFPNVANWELVFVKK